jgi:hypothetical protein
MLVLALIAGFFGSGILADPHTHTAGGRMTGGILLLVSVCLALVALRHVWWAIRMTVTGRGPRQ